MAKKTVTKEQKKEFSLKEVFAMWKKDSKAGSQYFEGKYEGEQIRGFYTTKKENPKEPDIRIYKLDNEGKLMKEEFLSLWCNATENGKKYLCGKLGGSRVVGFINAKATSENKQPYFTVYWSEDKNEEKTETKKEGNPF